MSSAITQSNQLPHSTENDFATSTREWDFGISLPVWCLTTVQESGLAIFKIDLKGGGTATPLFTEQELAESYVEQIPGGHEQVQLTILNVDELLMLFLGFCKCHGVTSVTFDPSESPGELHPLDEVQSLFNGLG